MDSNYYIENNGYVIFQFEKYDIAILKGNEEINAETDNVDVEVRYKNGKLYVATFFTLKNIEDLFKKNKSSGENLSGLFFYCKDMIIVEKLNYETIISTTKNLIDEDELATTFVKQ
jgi:hypothetical protein